VLLRKDPEELIEPGQTRPGAFALEGRELLPKSQIFEQEVPTHAEKANNGGQKEGDYV
jgi:hypothetical protein